MKIGIKECRVCNSELLQPILDLGIQAYTGIFPKSTSEFPPKGTLSLVSCQKCSLVQLSENFDSSIMYGVNYGYQSSLNDSMKNHLYELYKYLSNTIKFDKNTVILDIGSNDGTFLSFFKNPGLTRVGVDPTIIKFDTKYDSDIVKIPDFFTYENYISRISRKAHLITSISMMYDLERPIEFARDVFKCLTDNGLWFFEQSYLGLMIDELAYDTVCHEHLEYYSASTLGYILDKAGFVVKDFHLNFVNGGSIGVLAVKKSNRQKDHCNKFMNLISDEMRNGVNSIENLRKFSKRVENHRLKLIELINKLNSEGRKIAALGASTKGNVLLQSCQLDSSKISMIGEINADKFGHFTPGTNIPIVSEEEVFEFNPDVLMILPWHFRATFLKKTEFFRSKGGRVLFPLPEIEFVE